MIELYGNVVGWNFFHELPFLYFLFHWNSMSPWGQIFFLFLIFKNIPTLFWLLTILMCVGLSKVQLCVGYSNRTGSWRVEELFLSGVLDCWGAGRGSVMVFAYSKYLWIFKVYVIWLTTFLLPAYSLSPSKTKQSS